MPNKRSKISAALPHNRPHHLCGAILKTIIAYLLISAGASAQVTQRDFHALSFDGVDDYVEVVDTARLNAIGSGDFTFEAWFRGLESEQSQHPTLMSNRDNTTTGFDFFFHAIWNGSPNKIPAVQLDGLNYVYTSPPPPNLLDNHWHHFAATKEGDTLTYYHDGIQGTSFTSPNIQAATIDSPHPLWIGLDDPHPSTAFRGKIDDVRIWNRARTGAEIQNDMRRLLTGSEDGLVAYWDLDEGAGQIAGDTAHDQDGRLGSTVGDDSQDPMWMDIASCDASCNVAGSIFCDGFESGDTSAWQKVTVPQ